MRDKILDIVADYPTVKNIIVHTGSCDIVKQQSEVLKRDFIDLLNTVSSVKAEVFISGPLPPVRGGDEGFSRLFALNQWLSTACTDHAVHFINNFYLFWECRHLFKAHGVCLNKSGVKLFTSNLFFSLRHPSVPTAKDKRQEESKQEITTQHRHGDLAGRIPLPSDNQKEESPTSSSGTASDLPLSPPFRDDLPLSPPFQDEESLPPFPAPTSTRQTQRWSLSSLTLSPSSPHLEFTDHMKALVIAGTKHTPCPTPRSRAPAPPPKLSPSPQPVLTQLAKLKSPVPPPRLQNHPLSPLPDKGNN
ncbi:hypothetical protein VZT92_026712 [Zoarces viviparus]|uniref:Uncharacterized protein n=1 Tax=Zoarces viviparus TaxID=48416 RepID=A0AAW1DQY9_ZOAVI